MNLNPDKLINVKDKKNSHKCPIEGCKSSFSRPYRLSQHLLTHDKVKAFSCNEKGCNKSYTNNSHLVRHIKKSHTKEEINVLYSCPTCFKKYANRQNLKRHIKLVHNLQQIFICEICKEKFKKKHQLSTHLFNHTGVKAFKCEHCEAEFISLYDKKRHMRCHKTYKCETCKNSFLQWSKYQKHLITDHKPKVYTCNDCDRVFKQRVHMVRHIKQGPCLEMQIKLFPCPHENCERTYKRNSTLRQHILIKHENVKFQCNLCEATLCTKAKLNAHIKKIHENTEVKETKTLTKELGRKQRKDKGSIKIFTALKLTGIRQFENKDIAVVVNNNTEVK